jgi:hypothetical protein
VGYHPGMAGSVDWNCDGRPDLILACEGRKEVQYWENRPGGLVKSAVFKVPFGPVGIAVSDLDGDGRLDIVLGPYSGNRVSGTGSMCCGASMNRSGLRSGNWRQLPLQCMCTWLTGTEMAARTFSGQSGM